MCRMLVVAVLLVAACRSTPKPVPVSDEVCRETCAAWRPAPEVTIYGRRCVCAEVLR